MVRWCFLKVRCRGGRVISSGLLNPFAIAFSFLIQILYPFNLLSYFFFSLTTFFLLSKLRSCSGLQLTIKHLKVLRITVLNCPTTPQHSWVRSCSSEMFLAYSFSSWLVWWLWPVLLLRWQIVWHSHTQWNSQTWERLSEQTEVGESPSLYTVPYTWSIEKQLVLRTSLHGIGKNGKMIWKL